MDLARRLRQKRTAEIQRDPDFSAIFHVCRLQFST